MEENKVAMSLLTEVQQWVDKAPMEKNNYGISAQSFKKKIYIFGGQNDSGYLSDVGIYDPKSNNWTSGTPMPTPRAYTNSVVINEKIYVIGGQTVGTTQLTNIEIYDPETNTWESGTSMPTARSHMSSVFLGGKLYVMGGYFNKAIIDKVDIFDPQTNIWTEGKALPLQMSGFATVVAQNKICLLGGFNQKDGTTVSGSKMYIYDVKTETWEEGPSMPDAIRFHSANVVGNQIYVLGGVGTSTENPSSKVIIFDLDSNTWKNGPDMKRHRDLHASVLVDQTIYAIGGYNRVDRTSYKEMEALSVSGVSTNSKLAVYLNPEETVQLSVSSNLADNENLTWTSSIEAVATVDANGKATAVAVGLSDITATNADESFKEFIPVRVLPGTADLYRLAVHLTPGESKQLGMTEDLEGVTWKSMDESVVTVDTNGKITAIANGLAIIEATVGSDVQHIYVRVKAEV